MANSGTVAGVRDGRRLEWAWFAGWVAVGACAAFGLALVVTAGLVLVLLAAAAAGLLVRKGPGRAVAGLPVGLAVLVLYIGYLNRGGPGTVCHVRSGGGDCVDEYSPIPFVVGGVALLLAGLLIFVLPVLLDRWRTAGSFNRAKKKAG
ncbi:hypothetical protein [Streptomyces sp. NPDC008150]|uniref:hypothetical protein n=1 Tax=Streptomyces sp. NPDC008150 TaxID=3364816 RepID=UPI0036EA86E3